MATIPLTQGYEAIVDDGDAEWLSQYSWQITSNIAPRAQRYLWLGPNKYGTILMHREIMSAPKGVLVDHKNHNALDNRKENLRLVTVSQNAMNNPPRRNCSSNYKGVTRRGSRWRAQINRVHIGYFATEEEAARAYDFQALELFGEHAYLNFDQLSETTWQQLL